MNQLPFVAVVLSLMVVVLLTEGTVKFVALAAQIVVLALQIIAAVGSAR